MIEQVGIEVGKRREGEVNASVVAPQVDGVLAIVEGDGRRASGQRLVVVAHERSFVIIGVVHSWLQQVHQVGEVHVVVEGHRVVGGVDSGFATGILQLIQTVAGLRHVDGSPRLHQALEVRYRNVGY